MIYEKDAAAAAAAAAAKQFFMTSSCSKYQMRKSQWVSEKNFEWFSSNKQKTIGGAELGLIDFRL